MRWKAFIVGVLVAGVLGLVGPERTLAQLRPTGRLSTLSSGTAAAPSRTYIGDTGLGSFRLGADEECFTAGGVQRWCYNTTRLALPSGYQLSTAAGALEINSGRACIAKCIRLRSAGLRA